MTGILRIRREGNGSFADLIVHYITNVEISFSKRVATTPIISKGMDSTFPLESGSGMTLSFTFSRKNPENVDDESDDQMRWSNAKWYDMLSSMVNRWQLRTNGYILYYNDIEDTSISSEPNPYVASIKERGYIKRVTRRYSSNHNTLITGTIDVSVGTTYVSTDRYEVDEKYAFNLTVAFEPGELKNKVLKNASEDTGAVVSAVFGDLITNPITLSPSSLYVSIDGTSYSTIQVTLPHPFSLWASIADWCEVEFLGWEYDGAVYRPGSVLPINVSAPKGNIVATWS